MARSNVENLSPHVIRQIYRELCDLTTNPPEGIRVLYNEDDITSIQADIDGPSGTPYFGGAFRIRLHLGKNFPSSPPKGFFITKIFHPNVGRNGEICVNTLKKDWNQDLGIKHILLTIKCLLIVPNPESALNEEAGKMLLEHYDDYCKRAKMLTEIHAPKPKASEREGDCLQPSSSSVTTIGNNISNNNNNNNGTNNTTLYDKTTPVPASATKNTGGAQKTPLDGICCSEEPVTKRLNALIDCYNSTADQKDSKLSPMSNHQTHRSIVSSNPTTTAQQSPRSEVHNSVITNKNRGLKRVLRLRS